jgi:hypothetical protein
MTTGQRYNIHDTEVKMLRNLLQFKCFHLCKVIIINYKCNYIYDNFYYYIILQSQNCFDVTCTQILKASLNKPQLTN